MKTEYKYYHLAELPQRKAEEYPKRVILKYLDKETSKWNKITWAECAQGVLSAAKAFAQIGVMPGDRIGIYSQNLVFYLYAELGAMAMRAVSVPLYATCSPDQVKFVIEDSEIETLFVGEQFQYNNAYITQKKCPTLKRIVIFDSKVKINPEDTTSMFYDDFIRIGDSMPNETLAKVRMAEALDSDTAVIIYTSGTSGQSKGVVLTHESVRHQMLVHREIMPIYGPEECTMSFLPFSHIFEKAWVYFMLHTDTKVAILTDPKTVLEALPKLRPTMMCNVPRFWEKVYQGVNEKIDSSSPFMQRVYRSAIKAGRRYKLDYYNQFKKAPLGLRIKYEFYNRTIFKILKTVLGINKGKFFPTAGAPLSDEVNTFLQSVNIPIVFGYGLSETCATVSFYPRRGFIIGSIGDVIPGIDIRIDPSNNEILLRGKAVMKEYYKLPEETAKAFTEDGYFRTGDAGRLDGKTLYFTERIKDLYKTSNGKYVAPQMIEGLLIAVNVIEQVAVIGDERKFVSALIYPNWNALKNEASRRGLPKDTSIEDLASNHEVQRYMMSLIEDAQSGLAGYEKVKRITLITEPFTTENDELTNTLKLKRRVIAEHYHEAIEAMYVDQPVLDSVVLPSIGAALTDRN